ncbi:MAG: ATP-binding protein, partial [Polyangiaceae bacterium]
KLDPNGRPDGRLVLSSLARRQSARPSPLPEPHSESFVGRELELKRLRDALAGCKAGRAVTVLVEGESGVGKSALVKRFLLRAHAEDPKALVLRGRCHERERVPYNALDAAIDDFSRWLARSEFDASRLGVPIEPLLTVFPTLRAVPTLVELALGSSDPGNVPDQRGAAFAGLKALLSRLATERTVVLALDDLQWADADSLALLRELRRGESPAPVLLVATVRAEAAAEIAACLNDGHAELRRLPLGGLSRDEAAMLLAARGAACDLDDVLAETHGHPMFIAALAAAPQSEVRSTKLDDVLRSHVAGLHREARELVEIVAVAGAPIGNDALERVAAMSPEAYAGAIATLADARLVRAGGNRSADRVEPYHDRVREAVCESLSTDRARAIHARIASTLEALGAPADVLYTQFAGAGDRAKALHYGSLAADAAASALAFGRAAELQRALLAWGPHRPDDERLLSVALAEALQNDGRATEAAAMFLSAARIPGAEPSIERELHRRAAEQLLMSGHVKEGLQAAGSVLASVGLPLPERPAAILAGAGWNQLRLAMHSLRWEPRGENALATRDLERIDACWSVGTGLQMVDLALGSYFQTRGALECLAAGEPFRIARALCMSSISAAAAGRRPLALRLYETAKRAATAHGSPIARFYERLARHGLYYILENDWRACLGGAAEVEKMWRRLGRGDGWETDVASHFACSCLHQLSRPEFKERVRARIQTAVRTGNRFVEVTFRARYADVHLMDDDPREASADLEEALASWEPAGRSFGNQRMWGLWMRIAIASYTQEPRRALSVIRAEAQQMRRSILARLPVFILGWAMYLAGFELNCAREALTRREMAAAAGHVREAKRWMAVLAATGLPAAPGCVLIFDAACSHLQGDADAARVKLERGIPVAEEKGMIHMAVSAKRVLGTLLGGDDGAAMVRSADASLGAAGVKRPERYVSTQVPGFPV